MQTIQQKTILLSKKGMKELKKSVAKLERKQQHIIKELHELDKTDNHEHRLARVEKLADLEIVESQLADKQMYLSTAKLFPRKRDALIASLGSVVDLVDSSGRLIRYTLVDSIEANPSDGRISISSPLGQSLIGKRIQETIHWGNGIRTNKFTLIGIA